MNKHEKCWRECIKEGELYSIKGSAPVTAKYQKGINTKGFRTLPCVRVYANVEPGADLGAKAERDKPGVGFASVKLPGRRRERNFLIKIRSNMYADERQVRKASPFQFRWAMARCEEGARWQTSKSSGEN